MTNNFCFKPESRVNWAHGIQKWYWNYPKTSQGGAKESKIWVLRVDFNNDKSSSKNILSNWIFFDHILQHDKNPQISKKNFKTSISDPILISKQKKPESFCNVFRLMWHTKTSIIDSAWSPQVLTANFLNLFQNSSPKSHRTWKFMFSWGQNFWY